MNPLWYHGEILHQSRKSQGRDQTARTQLPIYELSCHELDETIHEKLTHPDSVWEGKAGLAFYLGHSN